MFLSDTVLATIIATVISSLVSVFIALRLKRDSELRELNLQLDSILKIAIEYPYLESYEFTKKWKNNNLNPAEEFRRYEVYATLVFNYLSCVSAFWGYDIKKISTFIDIKGWVKLHQEYWYNPSVLGENEQVYDEKFKEIIHSILGEIY